MKGIAVKIFKNILFILIPSFPFLPGILGCLSKIKIILLHPNQDNMATSWEKVNEGKEGHEGQKKKRGPSI
jgi:hypothetical protein